MVAFNATIEKFTKQGEKTGWTYFEIPFEIAEKINPSIKVSYRVKGFLDQVEIKGVSILPMGDGSFIMPLNLVLRKLIKKGKGETLKVNVKLDKEEYKLNEDLIDCLLEEKIASDNFSKLTKSHQNYYSKYIDSAKTIQTKAKRIAQVVNALHSNLSYAEMIRSNKGL